MDRKRYFLLTHPKIYYIYGAFKNATYKIKGIGKSGDCKMCEYCKNKGCIKNRIAKRFKMAETFGCGCYVPESSKNKTADQ